VAVDAGGAEKSPGRLEQATLVLGRPARVTHALRLRPFPLGEKSNVNVIFILLLRHKRARGPQPFTKALSICSELLRTQTQP
jgi:hypothetical protein